MSEWTHALQTRYAGCHFRSRLEARWAKFFDLMGIAWDYEPEVFDGPTRYLPDFWLPELNLWVEVKGSLDGLQDSAEQLVAALPTLPGLADSDGTDRGLLVLGPIPRPDGAHPTHWIYQMDGVLVTRRLAAFTSTGRLTIDPVQGGARGTLPLGQWKTGEEPVSIRDLSPERTLPVNHVWPATLACAFMRARSARFDSGRPKTKTAAAS